MCQRHGARGGGREGHTHTEFTGQTLTVSPGKHSDSYISTFSEVLPVQQGGKLKSHWHKHNEVIVFVCVCVWLYYKSVFSPGIA